MSVFKTDDSRLKTLEKKVEKIEKQVREISNMIGKPVEIVKEEEEDDYCLIS